MKKCPTLIPKCIGDTFVTCQYESKNGTFVGSATVGGQHIVGIEVMPSWRKRGCGGSILDDMIRRGGRVATASNENGEGLLLSRGFWFTGRVDDYGLEMKLEEKR